MTWSADPWDHETLERLRGEVQDYFRVFYPELRRLMAEHEDADLPYWFAGGREIVTSACTNGVLIVHSPYVAETLTFSEREDSFRFLLGAAREGLSVEDLVRDTYSITFPDGSRKEVMPEDWPGGDFGHYLGRWPAYDGPYPAGDDADLGTVSGWTRIEAASMSYLHVWRDTERARLDAWETVRPYVEEDDNDKLPVPRPR